MNGKHGVKTVKTGATFDLKKAAKLDPSESSYELKGTTKDGNAASFDSNHIAGFHYAVLWKTDSGAYRVTELGTIPPPPPSKKKGK